MDGLAHWAAVALLFAAPTSRALFNLSAFLLLVGWVLAGKFAQRWELAWRNPITLPALLLYGVIVLGAGYTPATSVEVLDHWERYSKFLLVPLMISVLDTPVWRKRAWVAWLAAMFLVLISTYANVWWSLPWSLTQNQGWGKDHSVFANYIAQGLVMAFFVAVCVVRGIWAQMAWHRVAWWAAGVLSAISITHLSMGRSGQLALVAVVLLLAVLKVPRRWRWMSFIGAALLIAAVFASSPLVKQRFAVAVGDAIAYEETNDYTSAGARLRMWEVSIDLIRQSPLIGHGTGSYHGLSAQAFNDPAMCAIGCFHPHNQLLFFGVEHGLVGMALFLFLVWRAWRLAMRRRGEPGALLACFVAVMMVDVFLHGPWWIHMEAYFFSTLLALLMAMAAADAAPDQSPAGHSRALSAGGWRAFDPGSERGP